MGKHWLDGFWVFDGLPPLVLVVKGEDVCFTNIANYDFPNEEIPPSITGTWSYGSFQECSEEIKKLSKATHFNVKMVAMDGKLTSNMVLAEDGKNLVCTAIFSEGVMTAKWVSKDELKKIADKRESCLSPSTMYKIQPNVQGKLLFLSGPPGSGKSVSGLLLAQTANYVYYEADCFINLQNPYLPLDVKEPSIAVPHQAPLKDFPLDTVKNVANAIKILQDFSEGKGFDKEKGADFCKDLANHVKQEKQRIGGLSWVVAMAVPYRWLREYIRSIIGPDCIFVVLSLSEATQVKRVEHRYASFDEDMKKMMLDMTIGMANYYEGVGEGEENAVSILINPEDNKEAVVQKILSAVKPYL